MIWWNESNWIDGVFINGNGLVFVLPLPETEAVIFMMGFNNNIYINVH